MNKKKEDKYKNDEEMILVSSGDAANNFDAESMLTNNEEDSEPFETVERDAFSDISEPNPLQLFFWLNAEEKIGPFSILDLSQTTTEKKVKNIAAKIEQTYILKIICKSKTLMDLSPFIDMNMEKYQFIIECDDCHPKKSRELLSDVFPRKSLKEEEYFYIEDKKIKNISFQKEAWDDYIVSFILTGEYLKRNCK